MHGRLSVAFLITLLLGAVLLSEARANNGDRKKEQRLFNGKNLENWEITDFGTQGPVKVKAGRLVLGMGEGATGVTWTGDSLPHMNYRISLQAMRLSGNDFFCGLTFPVRDSHLTLIVGGWGGFVVGLSCLDGLDASENETSTMMTFENNRWYTIEIQVADNWVQAWIDDECVIDISTEGRELSLRPEVLLSRPLGLATWYTEAAIKNIKLKRLD